MRIGAVLGGAAEGFKDTWTKMDQWRKEAEDRRAREAIAEGEENAIREGTVMGSRGAPVSASEWAARYGVPEEIAAKGPSAVQAYLAEAATAPAAAPPPSALPRQFDEAPLPSGPGQGMPASAEPAAAPRPQLTPADLARWHSYKDPIGGQVFYTDRPRRATAVDALNDRAERYERTGNPTYISQAMAMRTQAAALQEQLDENARNQLDRAIGAARAKRAQGDEEGAVQLAVDAYNEMFDDGRYAQTRRDASGQLMMQVFHADTGMLLEEVPVTDTGKLLNDLAASISSDNFLRFMADRREETKSLEASAAAAVQLRRDRAAADVAEGTVDADIEAGRLKPTAMRAGIDQTRASTAETRSQTGAREALLPGQLEQQEATLDDTREVTASRRRGATAEAPERALSDAQQRAVNEVVAAAEEAAVKKGLKPGTPAYQAEVNRHRDAGLSARGIRLPGTERYQPPSARPGFASRDEAVGFVRQTLPGVEFRVTDTYRSQARQDALRRRGLTSATRSDHTYEFGTDIVPNAPFSQWESIAQKLRATGRFDRVIVERGGRGQGTAPHIHLEPKVAASRADAPPPARPKPTAPARSAAIPARPAAASARAPVKRYPWGAPAK